MMKALYRQQGAMLDISILAEDEVQQFIDTHADVLNSSFRQVEMSPAMRQRLERSNWVFSGMKTFHELNESFPSLLDENGDRKPFERFLNDVRSIDETYNSNYLRSEYNFIHASASMAAKWEQFQEDGDRYNLQYRTAGDDRVRPEHAALEGVTLPIDDPFWEDYYPPNGWNCRCTVVQVRKTKYPTTPSDEAMRLGELATGKDTRQMFHFNPGKQQKAVPDYNPYTIRQCRTCPTAKGGDGNTNLASAAIPNTQLCEACKYIRDCRNKKEYYEDEIFKDRLLISTSADKKDLEGNIRTARSILSSFADTKIRIRPHIVEKGVKNPEYDINGVIADRKAIKSEKGIASGFKKGKEQGCKIIVIDLDESMKRLNENRLATHIMWRKADFDSGLITKCYIVCNGKSVVVESSMLSKDNLINVLKKLKQ